MSVEQISYVLKAPCESYQLVLKSASLSSSEIVLKLSRSFFFENGFKNELGMLLGSSDVDSVSFGAMNICFSGSWELFSESWLRFVMSFDRELLSD